MRGFGRILRCTVALSVLLALLTGLSSVALADEKGAITKQEKSYEIAVVFDNSGSMYNTAAWCRAKFAMEIFASMLDYDNGDRLVVFPMWEVLTDGTKYGSGSYKPVQITNKDDIDKIHNLFTVDAGETPFAPVKEAYDYLQTVSGKERWLIVLTDGGFNQDERRRDTLFNFDVDEQGELERMAGGQIKIQYLGFGSAARINENPARGLYSAQATETSLQQELVKICNRIFQRSELPKSYLSGNQLQLDLSMGKLIVFVQGTNARIDSLKDANGREIRKLMDSGRRTFSTLAAGDAYYQNAPVDNTLAGQVVSFANCTAGTYTLSYSDADNIQIFYEPDVDLSTQFLNADGSVVDMSTGEIVSGDYMVRYGLVDRVTGEIVTDHPLLDVKDFGCEVVIKSGTGDETKSVENGETITLEPETEISFRYSGTFLGDYTISAGGEASTQKLRVVLPQIDVFEAKLTAEQTWFVKRTYEEWKPMRADFTLNGAPLTDEQMQRLTATVSADPEMPLHVQWLKGESACLIHVSRDQDGNYVDGETGRFTMTLAGSFVDEFGREIPFSQKQRININEVESSVLMFWIILLILAILVALIILYFLIGLIKKLPKRVKLLKSDSKGKKLGLETIRLMKRGSTYLVKDRVAAKKVTPETGFHKRNRTSATFKVTGIEVTSRVISITIAGRTYARNKRKVIVDSNGKEVDTEAIEFSVYDGMKIQWTVLDSSNKKYSYVGEILINHK